MNQADASLPTGTQLPGGAVLPMSSVADFPMVLPEGKFDYDENRSVIDYQGVSCRAE